MSKASRPILITIVGALELLSGLALIVCGALIYFGSSIDLDIDFGTAAGIGFMILGLIPFVIGYGMIKGWAIMWYIGVIVGILAAIGGIITMTIVPTVIQLIILYYLFRPKVKEFFGI